MTPVDLKFLLNSTHSIPSDHGYALVGAVSRLIPEAHAGNGFSLAPIAGRQVGNRQMKLTPSSRFVVRTSPDRIVDFLPLAGQTIDIQGRKLVLGVPTIFDLKPCPTLRARMVTIKGFFAPELVIQAVRRQLDALEVGNCEITVGRKRTLCIKRTEIVGFETTISNLVDRDSLTIQANGIGGRRHMGCGFFVPVTNATFAEETDHGS